VILAEKCLSFDNPLREQLIDKEGGNGKLGEYVFQYPPHYAKFHLYDYPERMLSDIRYISQIMLSLLSRIDIILRDYFEDSAMEPLGEYHSKCDPPFIVLFPKEIRENAKNNGMDTDLLAAKTLIHELSHAFMDPGNYDWNGRDCRNHSDTYRQYVHPFMNQAMVGRKSMSFYHVREESMANIITCRVFMMAAKKKVIPYDSVKKVKSFISSQPDPYRLALSLLPTPNIWGWVKAKTGDPLSEDQAFEWMKEAEAWLSSNPDGKGYGKNFLIKEKGPWAVIEESDADSFFAPNHMIKRGDYYFLYDTSWNLILIFATPRDPIIIVSKDRFLIRYKEVWRCLDKSGKEACSIPSNYWGFEKIGTRPEAFVISANKTSSIKDFLSFEEGNAPRVIIAGVSRYEPYGTGNLLQIWKQDGLTGLFNMNSRQFVVPPIYEAIDYVKKDPFNRPEYKDSYNLRFLIGIIKDEKAPIDCEPIPDNPHFFSGTSNA
jgi:hypothetical protein